jgi:phage I-like protein
MAPIGTLLLAIGTTPPTEVRLFAAGENATSKGALLFDDEAADAVMAAFREHGMDRLPFDFDHGMFSGNVTAESSKAAGWFVPAVRLGDGGAELWATDIEWTPTAARMLGDREFRFFSPAIDVDEGGRVVRLRNVALTNLPATKNQMPMVASETDNPPTEGNTETSMKILLAKLSATDEAGAVAALEGLTSDRTALLAATEKTNVADAVALIADSRKMVVELAAKVAILETEKEASEKAALIARYSESGQAPPALHETLRKLSVADIKGICDNIPPAGSAVTQPAGEASTVTLSVTERHIAQQMGVSEADMIETKKGMVR